MRDLSELTHLSQGIESNAQAISSRRRQELLGLLLTTTPIERVMNVKQVNATLKHQRKEGNHHTFASPFRKTLVKNRFLHPMCDGKASLLLTTHCLTNLHYTRIDQLSLTRL